MEKLPYDVIHQIFLTTYLHQKSYSLVHIHKSLLSAPILLSHVSKSWRQIVLSIPQLCSYISIHADDHSDSNGARTTTSWNEILADRTRACLERSKSANLSIAVMEINGLFDIVELLMPHSGRWFALVINARLETFMLLNRAKDFSSLTRIHIRVISDTSTQANEGPMIDQLNLYQPAPRLETLFVNNYNVRSRARSFNVGFKLTNFALENLQTWIGHPLGGVNDINAIATRAKNIKNLLLIFDEDLVEHIRSSTTSNVVSYDHEVLLPIDSLSLTTPAEIDTLDLTNGTILPRRVRLPFLRRLVVRQRCWLWGYTSPPTLFPFLNFLRILSQASLPHYNALTHFTLDCFFGYKLVRDLLVELPNTVVYLKLDLYPDDEDRESDILSDMFFSVSDSGSNANFHQVLPRLQHVVVRQVNCIRPDFLGFLESRFAYRLSLDHSCNRGKHETSPQPHLSGLQSAFLQYSTCSEILKSPCLIPTLTAESIDRIKGLRQVGLVLKLQIDRDVVVGEDDEEVEDHFSTLEDELEWDERMKHEIVAL